MRSSAQGVLGLTLMLNTLFRAGSGGNNGCTLFVFVGLIALANDVSTVVAEVCLGDGRGRVPKMALIV